MKKLLSILITLSMLMSLALPAFGAEKASANTATFPKLVANLTDMNAISEAGLKASTEFTKNGSFTALLEGSSLSKTTTLPVEVSDLTGAEFIEMSIYSPVATATAFGIALVSDNPATAIVDYYYVVAACNFQGWKLLSFKMANLRTAGTPKGLDSIDKILLVPGLNGSMVDPVAKLYLDNIYVTDVESPNANVEQERPKIKPAIIYDASKGKPNLNTTGELVEFQGEQVLKWGPGDEVLRKGFGQPQITPDMHMERYKELVLEVYSAKATGNSFLFRFYGPSGSKRFYGATWRADWEGEWREIRIAISGGQSGYGDFSKLNSSTEEVNFELCDSTFFTHSTPPYTSTPFFPDTEIYIRKIYFDGERVSKTVANPTGEIIYDDQYNPDTMTDYVAMVKEKHPDKHHPRLIVTDELLDRIVKYKDTDPFMKKTYALFEKNANAYLEQPPTPPIYTNKTGTADQFNRTIEELTMHCGLMYLLTGETKYADRIWEEVRNMANSSKLWYQTSTGLDSGHIVNGMALAYDWCYDYWDREQKLLMRNAMMENALANAIKIRDGGGYMGFRNNVIAANSKGYTTAFLAICDEPGYENLANEYINNVIKYIPQYLIPQFLPDGNYAEGSTYWTYTIQCLSFMFTAMNTAMGTDGGLSDQPGLKETSLWPFGMRGPKGDFNHSDASLNALQSGNPAYHYLADRYNLPSLRAYRLDTYEKYEGINIYDIFWYNPEANVQLDWREGLPVDYFYGGLEPVLSFRSSYEPDALFIAGKGGNRMTGHDQSDAGSYVLDALGVRWIMDTGAGVYNTDLTEEYYYFNRAEAHNALYFNPETGGGPGGGQTIATNNQDTLCPIIDSGATDGATFGVLDLWPSYQEDTIEYKRGIALINNRTQFMVRDEFKATKASELYSYFHTYKDYEITINPDGKSLMMKSKGGQYLKVNFITDIPNFEIGVMDAVVHPASPRPGPDNVQDRPLPTVQKFYLHAYNVKEANITVVFTPMLEDGEVNLPKIFPLNEWDKYLGNSTALTGISIDGVPLAEFNRGLGSYNVETEKVGTVTATAGDDVELTITQAKELGEACLIKATNKNTGESFTYKINFIKYVVPGVSAGITFSEIEASHIPEPQNPPAHMTDGDLASRFAVDGYDGEAYFVTDHGNSKYLTGFSIAFYNGGSRKNKFKLEVSEDKENWTTVFDGFSPGNTDQLVSYEITPAWARYIRFTGYGCYAADEETQASKWNSLSEFVAHEQQVDFDDTTTHWAQPDIFFARINGLVNGIGDNKYLPENPVTRAEFLAMITRACNFPETPYTEGTYSDVKSDDWFSINVGTAIDKAIIPSEMVADGSFKPNQILTREEMCAIAVLAYSAAVRRDAISAGVTNIFKDLSDGPYLTYIDKAIGLRIVNGMSADTFAPKDNITRAQAAAILRRVFLKVYNTNN